MNIALDEIRSKAPKHATHYYQYKNGRLIFFKYFPDSDSLYRMTPSWTATSFVLEKLKPL